MADVAAEEGMIPRWNAISQSGDANYVYILMNNPRNTNEYEWLGAYEWPCPLCECDSWQDAGCVSETERRQTRVCTPAGCDIEEQTVADDSCAAPCSCTAWTDAGCISETTRRMARTCTPAGCESEEVFVEDPSCAEPEPEPNILVPLVIAGAAAAVAGGILWSRRAR
jgi:hypothetical protein